MQKRAVILILQTSWLLSGCAIQPEPLTNSEITAYAIDKRERVTANQEPLRGQLTLHEAMARALKYNLDREIEVMQALVSRRQLHVAHFSMLPNAVANTGYADRNNYAGGSSVEILGPTELGNQSLSSSTSSERDVRDADIKFSWHILDFGLSYIRAQQAADQVLIAEETQRRVVTRMLENVRTAYWRSVSATRLSHRIKSMEARVARALADTKALEEDGNSSPLTALNYERELLEIQRELRKLSTELSSAKAQLAALANLDPGKPYSVAIPSHFTPPQNIKLSASDMVATALEHRSELREVAYRKRINAHEAEAAILQMLPGISLDATPAWNSNTFLYNNHWVAWSAQASWNLIKVFSYPARRSELEAQDALLDARALAVTMAIMTQVHVGRARLYHARREFTTAQKFYSVQRRILRHIRSSLQSGKISEQTAIREEMNTLIAMVKRDMAFAELQSATAGALAAIGFTIGDHLPTKQMSIAEIKQAVSHEVRVAAR
ncbi:MAG: TolC family protein [Hyphomicrobiaceae bacterium]